MITFMESKEQRAKNSARSKQWARVMLVLMIAVAGCSGMTGIRLGSSIDDANLNAAVAERFAAEKSSDLAPVKAEVKGGIIYLSGTVASDEARTHAEKVGFQVPDSKGVVNNIQVEKK